MRPDPEDITRQFRAAAAHEPQATLTPAGLLIERFLGVLHEGDRPGMDRLSYQAGDLQGFLDTLPLLLRDEDIPENYRTYSAVNRFLEEAIASFYLREPELSLDFRTLPFRIEIPLECVRGTFRFIAYYADIEIPFSEEDSKEIFILPRDAVQPDCKRYRVQGERLVEE